MGDLSGWRRWWRRIRDQLSVSSETSVVGAEAIDDAPFLEVIGSHLYLHAITGKDANFVHPHASG